MGTAEDVADHHGRGSQRRNLLGSSLCALFALSVIYIIFYPPQSSFISYTDMFAQFQTRGRTKNDPSRPPPQADWLRCDYGDGRWVWDGNVTGPRYDSEHCDMKSTEKCEINGKPDNGYLHWRWQPSAGGVCNLPPLDPASFLRLARGKRLAFIGDSTARNQAESLVCHLSTASARPETAHRYEERLGRKFWRWAFPSPHGVTVSTYWSPFLVRAEGSAEDYAMRDNAVVLDALTEPWAAEVAAADVVVVSAGHWFRKPAMYYEDGVVVGVNDRPDIVGGGGNVTDIGYLGVYRKVMRRTLEFISSAKSSTGDKVVVVATIAPSHFDPKVGWNHRDACSRSKPFEEGEEAEVAAADAEMRKAVVEEVAAAAAKAKRGVRFEVLDVTKMATMRPDGHPGPYLFAYSYYNRPVPETVSNDCLHWCAPGVVDTFNDILAQMIAAGG
ncbi:hypothetical protein PR202_gb17393 [Eleusine coracana subsp. coracana]|uniref:Trichome birefringence-like N-terminal domain-containing protein n=1 Tax=Eleusine coracana subsp. coracana TaxID=191504 RepID=A0AAV5F2T9_ELECO|nr:hypothetical protein PR202_gb17393 [Eleusine coracana subsp. coracana]